MKEIRGKIDENDLAHVYRLRHEMPWAAMPCPIKKSKINPHASRFFFKGGVVTDVFHVKPIYYLNVNGEWRPLSEVTYGFGNRWAILKENFASEIHPAFLRWWMKRMDLIKGKLSVPYWLPALKSSLILNTHTTYFPDPDPETTSVDGFVFRSGVNQLWADIRAGAGTGFVDSSTAVDSQAIGANATATTDQWGQIVRSIYLWDTSNITDTDSIDSATASFFCAANSLVTIGLSVRVVTSTPVSNTVLEAADYGNLGTVAQSATSPTSAVWDDGQPVYVDFALNATGLTNISKTGVSKFGIKSTQDADNSAPTWSSGAQGEAFCHKAEAAGTGNDPKLVVTHTAAAAVVLTPNLLLLGVG